LIVTDFPTPEVPITNMTSPRSTRRSIPFSTGLPPNAFLTPLNSIIAP
jgi:hypothetical protein